jgi:hypothetical protein
MPPADGSGHPIPTAPECPLCSGENIDDGGFCLRCKERVVAPEWLLKAFGPADHDGTFGGMSVADMLHDHGFKCVGCGEVFGELGSVNEHGCCEGCEDGYRADWGGFDALREYGVGLI